MKAQVKAPRREVPTSVASGLGRVQQTAPRWATSCLHGNAQPSLLEMTSLGERLQGCLDLHGNFTTLRCAAARVRRLAASRRLTTVLLLTTLGATVSLLL
jgi:hypothetical protein